MSPPRFRDRKIFQWAFAYLAGSWVFLEVFGFIADRFAWSNSVVRGLTIMLGMGLFLVLVLAWYHGEKGRQWISGPELVWITFVLATAGLMLRFFAGAAHPTRSATPSSPTMLRTAATRFILPLPPTETLKGPEAALALSPDGRMLAYVAGPGDSTQLYLRQLDSFERRLVPGTEGARAPFFSPDGEWVGFFADGAVKKVTVRGGAPHTVVENAWDARWDVILSGSWTDDDVLFLSYPAGGLASRVWRVSARGGRPSQVTNAPWPENHFLPQLLPDGNSILYSIWSQNGTAAVAVTSLASGEQRIVLTEGSNAMYLASGQLLYVTDGDLFAAPFDLPTLKVTRPGIPIVNDVWTSEYATAHFGLSSNGTIAYIPARVRQIERTLVWVDSTGSIQSVPGTPSDAHSPRISSEGDLILFQRRPSQVLWLLDPRLGTLRSVTDSTEKEWWHVWRPGSRQIVFNALTAGDEWAGLYMERLESDWTKEPLTRATSHQQPQDWTPDGRVLMYTEGPNDETGIDIWTLRVPETGDEHVPEPEPYLVTPDNEFFPDISPDGSWIAYTSDMSGNWEVYVARYDTPSQARRVSRTGGSEPSWSPDGATLYYRSLPRRNIARQMFEVPVVFPSDDVTEARFGPAKLLFEGPFFQCSAWGRSYDIAPDGRRFLMVYDQRPATRPRQINVIVNWYAEYPD